MTDGEKLTQAKLQIGLTTTAQDTLLTAYLKDAGYFILSVTRQATVPQALEGAQIDLAVSAYTKRGAEGESSHSEGGVSATYESLSPALRLLLKSQTLAGMLDMNTAPTV